MRTRKYTQRIAGLLAAVTLAASPASALCVNSYEDIRDLLCGRFGICFDEIGRPELPDIELPEMDRPENNVPENNLPEIEAPEVEKPEVEDNSSADAFVTEVVRLVNAERAKAGLPALTMDRAANAAAQVRAREIVSNFSHTRPNGASCFTALREAGVNYRGAGENIAYGQSSAQAVVNAWMNSEGHRANILNAQFTAIGVGHHVQNGVHYWTQFFMS
ncbi:MAG: CAP domain-containing protein [Butyricicoccus sp.]|nr:CAP domain-containing protein [Butyricicoccus sp.]